MNTLSAIHNHILFKFKDRVTAAGTFEESKSSGGLIILGDTDKSAKSARWATVVSVGPSCKNPIFRESNCEILIENLRWTEGANFNGQTVWRTDEDQIMAYRLV